MPVKKPKQNQRRNPANAQWTIHIPTSDHHGNRLRDLTTVSHEWLRRAIPKFIHSIHAEGPYVGGASPYEAHHHLKVLAQDTPEVDSHVKQLATLVGELANRQSVAVVKEGQSPEHWTIRNMKFNGGPAHPDVVQFPALPSPAVSPSAVENPAVGEIPV